MNTDVSIAYCIYTANLRTKILDLRGFDLSIISILRGGILMSIRNFPESLGRGITVGISLVGRLCVVIPTDFDGPKVRHQVALALCAAGAPPGERSAAASAAGLCSFGGDHAAPHPPPHKKYVQVY